MLMPMIITIDRMLASPTSNNLFFINLVLDYEVISHKTSLKTRKWNV